MFDILFSFFDSGIGYFLCGVIYLVIVGFYIRKVYLDEKKSIISDFKETPFTTSLKFLTVGPFLGFIYLVLFVGGYFVFALAVFIFLAIIIGFWELSITFPAIGSIIMLIIGGVVICFGAVYLDKWVKIARQASRGIMVGKQEAKSICSLANLAIGSLNDNVGNIQRGVNKVKIAFEERSFEKFWKEMEAAVEYLNYIETEMSKAMGYGRRYIELHEECSVKLPKFPTDKLTPEALEEIAHKNKKLKNELKKIYEEAEKDYEMASFGLQMEIKDSITNKFAMLDNSANSVYSDINTNFRKISDQLKALEQGDKKAEVEAEDSQKTEKGDIKLSDMIENSSEKYDQLLKDNHKEILKFGEKVKEKIFK